MPDIPDNWKVIIAVAALAGGIVAPGALNLTTPAVRYKAFTSDDGDKLEARIHALEEHDIDEAQDCAAYRNRIDLKFEAMEWSIRKDMPPAATQARIRACERWIEKSDLTWEPPTLKWQ